MLSRFLARGAAALLLLIVLATPLAAQEREYHRSGPGTGDPDQHLVPWIFLENGSPLPKQTLVLYWFPAAAGDTERSPLRTSDTLLQYSSSCIAYEIVLPTDAATLARFGVTGKLPAAVLTDTDAKVLRTADAAHGTLKPAAVEQLITAELNARGEVMYRRMTDARRLAVSGDKKGAIDLYMKVWDEHCLFPTIGHETQFALKELGVEVHDTPAPMPVDPNLAPKPAKKAEPAKPPAPVKPPPDHR